MMKSVDTPSNYYLACAIWDNKPTQPYQFRIQIFQNSSPNYLTDIKLTSNNKIDEPYIVNHPLSTQVSERSSNFEGKGLYPPNKYDEYFLYSDSYDTTYIFKLCLGSARSTPTPVCYVDPIRGLTRGMSPIPSTSSVIVAYITHLTNPQVLYRGVYSVKIKIDGTLEIERLVVNTVVNIVVNTSNGIPVELGNS